MYRLHDMTEPPASPELVDVEVTTTAVIRGVVAATDFAAFFDRSFSKLASVLAGQGVEITGPAFALYHGPVTDSANLEVGFPTASEVQPQDGVEAASLPSGRAVRTVHAGGYDRLAAAWTALRQWIDENGIEPAGITWEVYVTEPSPDMDPADLRTELYWLLL